jgi:hypothetical protein
MAIEVANLPANLPVETEKNDDTGDNDSIIDDCDTSERTLCYHSSDEDSDAGTPLRMSPEPP